MRSRAPYLRLALAVAAILTIIAFALPASAAATLEPPAGSYQNSCVQIIVQQLIGGPAQNLEARCPNRKGTYLDTSMRLPCQGDIQNNNGKLLCIPGPNPFAPPPGSYTASCVDISVAGPILRGRCSTAARVRVETSINTLNCKGRDIRVNALGKLTC